jgi:YHS domain-containing protein
VTRRGGYKRWRTWCWAWSSRSSASVCSIGNIPLTAILWAGGISFAGVIAFIYADLITLPIILAYRKYYGTRFALKLVAVMFIVMVAAALLWLTVRRGATDPVCGVRVDRRATKHRAEREGRNYFFCSAHCRREFVAEI